MIAADDSSPGSAGAHPDPALLEALCAPETYGGRLPVEVHETHASWVFVVGASAYKVKKPVSLAFLDYSTLARGRAACGEEVRVNQELAPGIYLGVLAVVKSATGYRLAAADAPDALEYAVHMRSFDEADTLRGAIARGELTPAHIERAAERVAAFHDSAPRVGGGTPEQLRSLWRANLRELGELEYPDQWSVEAAGRFGEAFVGSHAAEIEQRVRDGHVRDGHGDLRCEHVLLADTIRIVDRIEFDRALRHVDVAADLAFLTMDLEAHGEPQAARELTRAYTRAGGSPGGGALQAYYGAHRAFVRAKVALLRDGTSGPATRAANGWAGGLWALGELLCWRARRPLALVVCGPPASGKSTIAGELARRSQLPVVSSDVVRKRSAGIPPEQHAGQEHYSAAFTEQTYELLGREALAKVRRDGGVIVDATCQDRGVREPLFAALRGAPGNMLVVECRVSLQTALARATQRMESPRRVSDATPQIVAELYARFQPLDELPAEAVHVLDAERGLARQVADVVRAVDRRLGDGASGCGS